MSINSFELLRGLKKAGYPKSDRDELWWPNSGTFEIVVGAILTQNTKWQNVQKALDNLNHLNLIDIEALSTVDGAVLANAIRPSGFFNVKAKRLKTLSQNIMAQFGTFEAFQQEVSREWLLSQKGLGDESVDAILCYACYRDEMVADAYSYRLLRAFGIDMPEYEDVKNFLSQGIIDNLDEVYRLYGKALPLYKIYALFHGKIVEYCANNSHKKQVDITPLRQFLA